LSRTGERRYGAPMTPGYVRSTLSPMSGLEQEGDGPPDEVEFGEVVEAEVKRLVRHPREETARLKQVAADGEHGSAPYIEIALVARY
jgi:hypothetical protein